MRVFRFRAARPFAASVASLFSRARHNRSHREGWRERPYETPATTEPSQQRGEGRCQFRRTRSPKDVTGSASASASQRQSGGQFHIGGGRMPAQALQCKECQAEYPLEARYVCENCFGPLEVSYDFTGFDADSLRRRIQAGPLDIWRYSDFLPFEQRPQTALAAGMTPLVKADRLAKKLGVGEGWVKNDAANPTHSFKDRVVTVAIAKARELGYEVVACASTGNLANA